MCATKYFNFFQGCLKNDDGQQEHGQVIRDSDVIVVKSIKVTTQWQNATDMLNNYKET